MLIDTREKTIVAAQGWNDKGALWILDVDSGKVRKVGSEGARYLTLYLGRHDHFAAVHNWNGEKVAITVHSFANPETILARCEVAGNAVRVRGTPEIWSNVPSHYVAYLMQPTWSDFGLISIDHGAGASLQSFDWYNDSYDKGYQGVGEATEIPGSNVLIISVQRSSRLIFYDPEKRAKVGELALADRNGNPTAFFRRTANELWADDYDTLLKIGTNDWRILDSQRLQDGRGQMRQFIGEFSFDVAETLCGVARPFSGDVVGIDPTTFKVTCRARLGDQPLSLAVLRDRRVFARDWMSGRLLEGTLR